MDTVSLLIKPSSLCNLRCEYCFYYGQSRNVRGDGMMSDEMLQTIVRRAFSESERRVVFAFQGGEPTLAGLDFFKRLIELEKQFCPQGVAVEHSIQTNGIALTAQWADFFRENAFLVGLSLDGNAALHNRYRRCTEGGDTYNKVSAALDMLTSRGAAVNILCVVTGQTARRAQSVYEGFKRRGCRYLQFIPCLDPPDCSARDYSLTPGKYSIFLKTLFDGWYNDWERGNYVSVRLFDDYVHILAGHRPGSCAASGSCGQYLTVESDGSVYPCDFYTEDAHLLGNIEESAISGLLSGCEPFIAESKNYPQACAGCEYFELCRGGCRRDRRDTNGDTANYYCEAFREFFAYSLERLKNIAALERKLTKKR